ncbi:Eukaryotic translation initiation factor-related, putative isoform 2 [Cucumis melo var. makuwa]|nr:Eukaryotic translation initiation factor-related, putative isoform 2 [Cucumis melo var. makuwa]TYJ99409.1 Eukaryotic translation initiation factor-related, putative isoform 2 [Cucumis melo var. makuwa]
MNRSDHRSRPHSSPATRHFDDKTPFLAPAAHIGRNFDEDERKPLGGVTPPRRTISDESIRVLPSRNSELKPEYESSGRRFAPMSQFPTPGAVNSYAGRVGDALHSGVASQNSGGGSGMAFSGAHPNAWQARKEVASGLTEHSHSAWDGPSAVSKLAHASALEKVSSGRWQSKQSLHYQTDVVAASSELDVKAQPKGYGNSFDRVDGLYSREHRDASLARHAERELSIDDGTEGHRQDLSEHDRVVVPKYHPVKERSSKMDAAVVQHSDPNQMSGGRGSDLHPPVSSLVSERPKLKLLPRSKPLAGLEPNTVDHTQMIPDAVSADNVNEMYGNSNYVKLSSAGSESGKDGIERPKLNLKPRSQPIEQSEGNAGRDRIALFGGARPREQVLKERGIDNTTVNNNDLVQHSERTDENFSRTERVQGPPVSVHQTGKADNPSFDRRIVKEGERKDNKADPEMQRRNFRDNRRKNRETDKQQQQHERPPSPETWRKPAEQPKPASPNAGGMRYGKVASALELAQAFSRSVSDSNVPDRVPSQRNLPGRSQMPFSRLMGPSPRPQINGY